MLASKVAPPLRQGGGVCARSICYLAVYACPSLLVPPKMMAESARFGGTSSNFSLYQAKAGGQGQLFVGLPLQEISGTTLLSPDRETALLGSSGGGAVDSSDAIIT